MPKFIKLTPAQANCKFKTAYVNCDAIESIFCNENTTQINFIGVSSCWLEVVESAETVVKLAEES